MACLFFQRYTYLKMNLFKMSPDMWTCVSIYEILNHMICSVQGQALPLQEKP